MPYFKKGESTIMNDPFVVKVQTGFLEDSNESH